MKDPKSEEWLNRGGYKYSYRQKVPLSEIDMVASLANPSRLHRNLDDDRVLNYGISMEAGVEFPAIVLLNLDPAVKSEFKWLIATGCHRTSAMEMAKITETDAYIVTEADNYRREWLCRMINTIEGVAPSVPDTMRQLCLLHQNWGKPLAQLARENNVKLGNLQSYWNEEQAIQRARRFGFDVNRMKLARRALIMLHGIHSDVLFEKSLHFVNSNTITTTEVEILAREIKKTRDEKAGLDIIAKHEKEIIDRQIKTKAKHGRISPTGANKLRHNCRAVVHQLEDGIEKLHLSAYSHPSDLKVLIGETMELLKKVHLELDRIERMSGHGHPDQPGMGPLH